MGNLLKRFASTRSRKSSKAYEDNPSVKNTGNQDHRVGTKKIGSNIATTVPKDAAARQSLYKEVGMSTWKPPKRSRTAGSTPSTFKTPRRTWSDSWSQRKIGNFVLPSQEILGEGRPPEIVDEAPADEEAEVNPLASVTSLKSLQMEEPEMTEETWTTGETPTLSAPEKTPSVETPAAPAAEEPPLARYLTPPTPEQIQSEILNTPSSVVTRKPPAGIVTLNVNGTPYYIHKDYLMHHSKYFRSALEGPWIECTERHIDFDDEGIELPPFNVMVHWLYTQQLPQNLDDWVKIAQAPARKIEIVKLKALVLADRFCMPEFLRAVNNDLVNSRMHHAPYYELIIYAFTNLPPSSPLLRCLVDLHCLHWDPESDENDEEEMMLRPQLPYEFLMNVMCRYGELKVGSKGKTSTLDPRDYYID